jgi:hypothetical protein
MDTALERLIDAKRKGLRHRLLANRETGMVVGRRQPAGC